MVYSLLKIIQITCFNLVYGANRLALKALGVKIGKNLKTLPITTIENPSAIKIGDNVWISKNVGLYAVNGIEIGNDVIIAKDVSLISGDHQFANIRVKINEQGMRVGDAPIVIGNDVWIGEKAIILKGVIVGDGSVIGAGSVVTKNIPEFSVVAGNPAKVIRQRSNKE
jgi:maltose O-acetyltransferase